MLPGGASGAAEADSWCPDVVTQIASATRALQEVAVGLLNDHLHDCVRGAALRSDSECDQLLAHTTGTIRQIIRL